MGNRFALSLLICHLPERAAYLQRLLELLPQEESEYFREFEVLVDDRPKGVTIGEKRNALHARAKGEYLAFIDDDDLITERYFPCVFEGIRKGVDCCSLKGIITDDGNNPRTFIHSLKYDSWFEKGGVYYRPINHLNLVRADLAKQIRFPEKNHGEDKEWSMALHRSGLLKLEHQIDDIIYLYEHISKK